MNIQKVMNRVINAPAEKSFELFQSALRDVSDWLWRLKPQEISQIRASLCSVPFAQKSYERGYQEALLDVLTNVEASFGDNRRKAFWSRVRQLWAEIQNIKKYNL